MVAQMRINLGDIAADAPAAADFYSDFRNRLALLQSPVDSGQVVVINSTGSSRYQLTVAITSRFPSLACAGRTVFVLHKSE